MKFILILLAVFTAQTFANDFLACFAPVLDNINAERADLVAWGQDVRATGERLLNQRERCNNINRDDPPTSMQERMIQACQAALTASVAYESSRLFAELRAIDPELAASLREQSAICFAQEPQAQGYFERV